MKPNLLHYQEKIETWLQDQWTKTPAAFYGSIDLRNADFKLSPVDMNLYPAGFNNLSHTSLTKATQAAKKLMNERYPGCQSILLIPENHSRNMFYWESVSVLLTILQTAGFLVRIGADPAFFPEKKIIHLNEKNVYVEPIQRRGDRLILEDFDPCLVWLNNDLSSGIPKYLQNIKQPICPPIELGWHRRLKSLHFAHYRDVVSEFSALLKIDPWLLDPLFRYCGQVDFMKKEGEICLSSNIEKLLEAIQKKYDDYGIKQTPFVIVKADAGTYGMSVMSIKSVDEIRQLNRKQRTHMSTSKGNQQVQRVIIQEGVYSIDKASQDQSVAEPVIYMIGAEPVGGFYRLHKNKTSSESLNTPGMTFEPYVFDFSHQHYDYSVVARLSMLAAAREQKEVEHHA